MLISAERSKKENDIFWSGFPERIQEDRVPPYVLPDPMVCFDGRRITGPAEWETIRRPELLKFYQEKLYGFVPPRPDEIRFELTGQREDALNNLAVRKEITIRCSMKDGRGMSFPFLLYLPKKTSSKVPVFVTMNFYGNPTVLVPIQIIESGEERRGFGLVTRFLAGQEVGQLLGQFAHFAQAGATFLHVVELGKHIGNDGIAAYGRNIVDITVLNLCTVEHRAGLHQFHTVIVNIDMYLTAHHRVIPMDKVVDQSFKDSPVGIVWQIKAVVGHLDPAAHSIVLDEVHAVL